MESSVSMTTFVPSICYFKFEFMLLAGKLLATKSTVSGIPRRANIDFV